MSYPPDQTLPKINIKEKDLCLPCCTALKFAPPLYSITYHVDFSSTLSSAFLVLDITGMD